MRMIYSHRANYIVFDDYVDETKEYGTYYVQMCSDCFKEHREMFDGKEDPTACGICSVEGCWNEADYYVDFKPEEIEIDDAC